MSDKIVTYTDLTIVDLDSYFVKYDNGELTHIEISLVMKTNDPEEPTKRRHFIIPAAQLSQGRRNSLDDIAQAAVNFARKKLGMI